MKLDEFQDALTQISNASIVALDEMWSVSPGGEPVSLMDTLGDSRATDPADLLDVSDLRDTLADAIARLPERERIVVALYYYDNLSLKEIGEILGRHREPGQPAPHEGRAAPEGAPPGRRRGG